MLEKKKCLFASRDMPPLWIVLLCLLPYLTSIDGCAIAKETTERYDSPDHKLSAVIVSKSDFPSGAWAESTVTITNSKRHVLQDWCMDSEDHDHGYGVVHSQWSPDSKYFVFTTASSGGHSAWHFPTKVYIRDSNEIEELDDYVGLVVEPKFCLSKPDIITIAISYRSDSERYEDWTNRTLKGSLRRILTKRKDAFAFIDRPTSSTQMLK